MIFAVLLGLVFHSNVLAISITGVAVIPSQPLDTDLITFSISGVAGHSPSEVDHDVFTPNGASLHLDLYVDTGFGTTTSYWDYSKQIQPLAPGTYSLEVRAFDNYYNTLADTYETVYFTVTPEPASAVMLGIGAVLLASRRKRREFGNRDVAAAGKPATGIVSLEKDWFVKH